MPPMPRTHSVPSPNLTLYVMSSCHCGVELAGIGLAPASAAFAASLQQRPGWDQDTMAWAALTEPTPVWPAVAAPVGDQLGEVALVIAELSVDPAYGEGEAAGLGAPDGVFAGLVLTAAAARDGSEPVGGQGAAGQRSVGVAHDHRRRAVWAAGRRLGAARATRPGGRRSGPSCPAAARPDGDVRSLPRSIPRLATPGPVRFRSCGCPRARPPPAGPGHARRSKRSLRQSRARRCRSSAWRCGATGRGQFKGVRVTVRVAADDGVDNLCQHRHAASDLLPGMRSVWSAPA